MERARKDFRPRAIDRVIFGILSVLLLADGLYLVGPWYLDMTDDAQTPLLSLFNSSTAVVIYGVLLLVDGIALIYASAGRSSRRHTLITEGSLLAGFLLRLYALIGVYLTLESWRPPSYLSGAAVVTALGAYWVWVKINVRPV